MSEGRENQDMDKGGVKFDLGKPRWGLLSWPAIRELVKVLTYGAKKYRDHNWATGMAYSRNLDACLRHITSWASGQKLDQETGLSHLAHAMCCLMFLLTYDLNPEKYADNNDLFIYDNDRTEPQITLCKACGFDIDGGDPDFACICRERPTTENRYLELSPQEKIDIDELINTLAAHKVIATQKTRAGGIGRALSEIRLGDYTHSEESK